MFHSTRKSGQYFLTALCLLSMPFCFVYAAPGGLPATLAKPPVDTPAVPIVKAEVRPLWSELTAPQRLALAPLESEWSKIDAFRKKKWLQISKRFDSMKPDEQQRLHEKMRIWAKLSPDERRHAREVYSRTKNLGAEQKSAQWQEYQLLPETEKKRLAKDIAARKHVANLPVTPASPLITPPKVLAAPAAKIPAPSATTSIGPANSVPAAPAASPVPGK